MQAGGPGGSTVTCADVPKSESKMCCNTSPHELANYSHDTLVFLFLQLFLTTHKLQVRFIFGFYLQPGEGSSGQ